MSTLRKLLHLTREDVKEGGLAGMWRKDLNHKGKILSTETAYIVIELTIGDKVVLLIDLYIKKSYMGGYNIGNVP